MKTLIAGMLSAGLLVAVPGAASAGHARNSDSYSRMYPSATPQQLQNLRAYERGGEYYEQQADWKLSGKGSTGLQTFKAQMYQFGIAKRF